MPNKLPRSSQSQMKQKLTLNNVRTNRKGVVDSSNQILKETKQQQKESKQSEWRKISKPINGS